MKIINVVPIVRGAPANNLSYFTSQKTEAGDLVLVPLNNKIIPAIVSSLEEIKDVKTSLKNSSFSLKPIKTVKVKNFIGRDFAEAGKEIADYFSSSLGSILRDFVPSFLLEPERSRKKKTDEKLLAESGHAAGHERSNSRHEIILIQAPAEERHQYYKSIIREEFAKNHSIFFLMPTAVEIGEFSAELQKGIEKYSVIMHPNMPKRKLREEWKRATTENHPLLIVATKSFLSVPRRDINTIIVDCESSPHYKLQRKPYADVRKAAELISKKMKTRLVFGDLVLRNETAYRQETGVTAPSPSSTARLLSSAEQIIVDIKKKQADNWQKTKIFSMVSPDLKTLLENVMQNNEKMILLVNRRGYNPTTVCNDCLRTILCNRCEAPLVLHKTENLTTNVNLAVEPLNASLSGSATKTPSIYVCHKCLNKTAVFERCPYCKSYRLETLGGGIQKAAEEIAKFFPKLKIFRLDGDVVKNEKQGREIAERFLSSPGSVLIGTEVLFYYIKQPVERAAAVSLDAMFTLPDFRNNERIFHLLLKLRGLAKKTFLIQTRLAEQSLFNEAIKGNVSSFYRQELENRKLFEYPPFKLIIKITGEDKSRQALKEKVLALEKYFQRVLPDMKVFNYPAFTPKVKNNFVWHVLLKIDPKSWPYNQPKLVDIFGRMPSNWKVDVEPESLL